MQNTNQVAQLINHEIILNDLTKIYLWLTVDSSHTPPAFQNISANCPITHLLQLLANEQKLHAYENLIDDPIRTKSRFVSLDDYGIFIIWLMKVRDEFEAGNNIYCILIDNLMEHYTNLALSVNQKTWLLNKMHFIFATGCNLGDLNAMLTWYKKASLGKLFVTNNDFIKIHSLVKNITVEITHTNNLELTMAHLSSLTTMLVLEEKPAGLISLFTQWYEDTSKFAAAILWLIQHQVPPSWIIKSGILHNFIRYNYHNLEKSNDDDEVKLFYNILQNFNEANELIQLTATTQCHIKSNDLNKKYIAQYSLMGIKITEIHPDLQKQLLEVHEIEPPFEFTITSNNFLNIYQAIGVPFLTAAINRARINKDSTQLQSILRTFLEQNVSITQLERLIYSLAQHKHKELLLNFFACQILDNTAVQRLIQNKSKAMLHLAPYNASIWDSISDYRAYIEQELLAKSENIFDTERELFLLLRCAEKYAAKSDYKIIYVYLLRFIVTHAELRESTLMRSLKRYDLFHHYMHQIAQELYESLESLLNKSMQYAFNQLDLNAIEDLWRQDAPCYAFVKEELLNPANVVALNINYPIDKYALYVMLMQKIMHKSFFNLEDFIQLTTGMLKQTQTDFVSESERLAIEIVSAIDNHDILQATIKFLETSPIERSNWRCKVYGTETVLFKAVKYNNVGLLQFLDLPQILSYMKDTCPEILCEELRKIEQHKITKKDAALQQMTLALEVFFMQETTLTDPAFIAILTSQYHKIHNKNPILLLKQVFSTINAKFLTSLTKATNELISQATFDDQYYYAFEKIVLNIHKKISTLNAIGHWVIVSDDLNLSILYKRITQIALNKLGENFDPFKFLNLILTGNEFATAAFQQNTLVLTAIYNALNRNAILENTLQCKIYEHLLSMIFANNKIVINEASYCLWQIMDRPPSDECKNSSIVMQIKLLEKLYSKFDSTSFDFNQQSYQELEDLWLEVDYKLSICGSNHYLPDPLIRFPSQKPSKGAFHAHIAQFFIKSQGDTFDLQKFIQIVATEVPVAVVLRDMLIAVRSIPNIYKYQHNPGRFKLAESLIKILRAQTLDIIINGSMQNHSILASQIINSDLEQKRTLLQIQLDRCIATTATNLNYYSLQAFKSSWNDNIKKLEILTQYAIKYLKITQNYLVEFQQKYSATSDPVVCVLIYATNHNHWNTVRALLDLEPQQLMKLDLRHTIAMAIMSGHLDLAQKIHNIQREPRESSNLLCNGFFAAIPNLPGVTKPTSLFDHGCF